MDQALRPAERVRRYGGRDEQVLIAGWSVSSQFL
jgi:hypothetical protein